jgi:hypothetical protein
VVAVAVVATAVDLEAVEAVEDVEAEVDTGAGAAETQEAM